MGENFGLDIVAITRRDVVRIPRTLFPVMASGLRAEIDVSTQMNQPQGYRAMNTSKNPAETLAGFSIRAR
jgi:hypothetical protein